MRTSTLPDNSVELITASLLMSSMMVTTGAVDVLSRTAPSVPAGETLPAASVMVAVTTIRLPSGGGKNCTFTVPLLMSAAVSTTLCGVVPSVTISVSPATAVPGNVTATSTLPDNSLLLISASLLASSVMTTVGASEADVSRCAVSDPGAETLPAASVNVAVTVIEPPSAGGTNAVTIKPVAI